MLYKYVSQELMRGEAAHWLLRNESMTHGVPDSYRESFGISMARTLRVSDYMQGLSKKSLTQSIMTEANFYSIGWVDQERVLMVWTAGSRGGVEEAKNASIWGFLIKPWLY